MNKNKRIKIIVCPNSFKESLTAFEVAQCISKGIISAIRNVEIIKIPVADGGDGTLEVLVAGAKGKYVLTNVSNPLGEKIKSKYGLIDKGKTAIIEMAQASGLRLVPCSKRNPMKTTTYGTGELIKKALDGGVNKVIIGVGGSATVDAGLGMAMSLGGILLDKSSKPIKKGGQGLLELDRIDLSRMDKRLKKTEIIVACDVKNPLIGPQGTVALYSRQKGATEDMMLSLEKGMKNFIRIIKRDLDIDLAKLPGGGAAGGLASGIHVFCNGRIESGIDVVLDNLEFDKYLRNADLVITGEGQLDSQTVHGKAPIGVAKRARKMNIPVISIAGNITEGAKALHHYGITSMLSIQNGPMTLEESIKNSRKLITNLSSEIARMIYHRLM